MADGTTDDDVENRDHGGRSRDGCGSEEFLLGSFYRHDLELAILNGHEAFCRGSQLA